MLLDRCHPDRRVTATLALAAMLAVAGCKLVDQTSFGGAPRPPSPDALAAALASHGAAPLLVIRPRDQVPYQDALREAIAAAAARNGNVRFRLESAAPQHGTLLAQQSALEATSAVAQQVLSDMEQDGIAPDRVDLTARAVPDVQTPEIRLYQG